ncbi:hypothetical protein BDY21DRAFT_369174 [Lineolata rhizophorae]|uniref:NAD(P)-binding protein n=1 Tax=Lineolata rhizophorae TaxID=578093 RepID=A0A6A6PAW3_9PEZI|nr:hypothetical protein BDY21DRAFT_369174 [Lineolata rhizophorae]
MPVYIIKHALSEGVESIPYLVTALNTALITVPWIALLALLKWYFGGARNNSERLMHGKVIMMTGATSGIGAAVAKTLASRGAQIVLLTQHPLSDPFLVDYIMDLRAQTKNQLITAEHVDLSSLQSIRVFATKWVDNAPPRRLDMLILCANTFTPPGGKLTTTKDGLETSWGLNYIANFHLLSILSPALRAQPPDRDVRVIFGSCSSYMGGKLPELEAAPSSGSTEKSRSKMTEKPDASSSSPTPPISPSSAHSASYLALMTFAAAFQKHLSSYARPDKAPCNARVLVVDPGWSRTPGMRRWLTFGSLWGLLAYLLTWPLWWLVLKSSEQGAQGFLWAAMEGSLRAGGLGAMVVESQDEGKVGEVAGPSEGSGLDMDVKFVKECRVVRFMREEITSEQAQKALWQASEKTVEMLEKEGAMKRAKEKKKAGSEEASKEEEDGAAARSSGAAHKKPGSRRSRKAE